jgi:WD40 repeat protein
VPGYEIIEELGRGGMGVVYKARHLGLDRTVALKVILAGQHAEPGELLRFVNEARAVAGLQHPNVVQLHESGQHAGVPYFTLEYVPGGTLAQRLRERVLEPHEAARLLEAVARGVHHFHQRGVVHRDLKPQNILLTADGTPKVADFGLARRTEAGTSLTPTDMVLGTPSYMAPEQAAGKTSEATLAADIWSLGAVLYACLTGRPPFVGTSHAETLLHVLNDDPLPPRSLSSGTPRDLDTICLKCLNKEPGKRYLSAEALADDLRRFQEGRPILARPVGWGERAWRWCRRNPLVATLGTTTAAALVLGLAGALWEWGQAEHARAQESSARRAEESQRRQATAALEREQAQHYLHRIALAERDLQANNPAQARATLDACPELLRHWEWYYLERLGHPELLTLSGHGDMVSDVAFSPDRRLLACATSSGAGKELKGEVQLRDVKTGQVVRRYRGHPHAVKQVVFHPDGKRVVSVSLLGLVKVWDADTGEDLWHLDAWQDGGKQFQPDRVAWSPDGKLLALDCTTMVFRQPGVAPEYQGSEVLFWDLAARRETFRFHSPLSEIRSLAFTPDGKFLVAAGKEHTGRFSVSFMVKVWDAATGMERQTLPGRWCMAVSPDGKRVASLKREDAGICVWEIPGGREVFVCRGHTDLPNALAYSPDARYLVSGGGDRGVKVWDARSGQEAFTLHGHTSGVVALAFHADSRRLASCAYDSEVRVWDVSEPPEGWVLHTAANHARSVTFDASGGRVAFVQTDKNISVGGPLGSEGDTRRLGPSPEAVTVRDATTGKVLLDLKGRAWAVAWSPDGNRLAAAANNDIRFWDTRTGTEQGLLRGHTAMVTALAFSPDGKRLVSAGDKTVRTWDISTGREALPPLSDAPGSVWSVAWSGDRVAAAGLDKTVHIWDANTGAAQVTFRGHTAAVMAVTFTPDGKRVASAGWDQVIRLWEADTGQEVVALTGHREAVLCLAFSDDGRRLASGGNDRMVKVWDLDTQQEALTLRGHTDKVNAVAFRPGSRVLASAGEDGRVRLWGAAPPPLEGP